MPNIYLLIFKVILKKVQLNCNFPYNLFGQNSLLWQWIYDDHYVFHLVLRFIPDKSELQSRYSLLCKNE